MCRPQGPGGWGSLTGCLSGTLLPTPLPAGRSHVMQRVLSTMQFLWVLGQTLVDELTRWLHTFTRHHSAMSDVLRAERYLLTQELLRVGAATPQPQHTPNPPPCPSTCPCPRLSHAGGWSRAGTTSTALSLLVYLAGWRGAPGRA